MLVFIDMEWFEAKNLPLFPTQIAAVRIDKNWLPVAHFFSLCHPPKEIMPQNHMAFSGAKAHEFLSAPAASSVLVSLENWLDPKDIVYWWHQDSKSHFGRLFRALLSRKSSMQSAVICQTVKSALAGNFIERGNPYQIAKARSLTVPSQEHYAPNDVETLRLLMQSVFENTNAFLILQQRGEKDSDASAFHAGAELYAPDRFPYWIDVKKNILHADHCNKLTGESIVKGCSTLKPAIRTQARACSCCARAYREAMLSRNRNILKRTQYNFVYAPDAKVFHRYDCICVQNISSSVPQGAMKYDTCIHSGRIPCRLCKPTPYTKKSTLIHPAVQAKPSTFNAPPISRIIKPAASKPITFEDVCRDSFNRSLNGLEQRAVNRFFEAHAERFAKTVLDSMTADERSDFLTLTQSGFAFWAGRGYNTFHLRNCPRLKQLSQLRGFALYNDAFYSGLTPCKQCKPSKKYDLPISVPITCRPHPDETPESINERCDSIGYAHHIQDNHYHIVTPVGKWRFHLLARPITLDHINLTRADEFTQYHQQPRLFFSLTDVFEYVRHHDYELWKKLHPGSSNTESTVSKSKATE